jgi:hypothetical protein
VKKLSSVNFLLRVSMVKIYQGPSGGHGLSAVCGRISELFLRYEDESLFPGVLRNCRYVFLMHVLDMFEGTVRCPLSGRTLDVNFF